MGGGEGKKKKKRRGRECEERERDLPDQCQAASYAPESDSVCAHLQLLVITGQLL